MEHNSIRMGVKVSHERFGHHGILDALGFVKSLLSCRAKGHNARVLLHNTAELFPVFPR